jgi:hypothetical protein
MVGDEQFHGSNVSWFSTEFRVWRCLSGRPVRGANYSGAFSKMLLPGPCHMQVLGDLVLIEVTMLIDDCVKGGGCVLESLNG